MQINFSREWAACGVRFAICIIMWDQGGCTDQHIFRAIMKFCTSQPHEILAVFCCCSLRVYNTLFIWYSQKLRPVFACAVSQILARKTCGQCPRICWGKRKVRTKEYLTQEGDTLHFHWIAWTSQTVRPETAWLPIRIYRGSIRLRRSTTLKVYCLCLFRHKSQSQYVLKGTHDRHLSCQWFYLAVQISAV